MLLSTMEIKTGMFMQELNNLSDPENGRKEKQFFIVRIPSFKIKEENEMRSKKITIVTANAT